MAFSTLHLFTNNKLLIWIKNKSYLLQLLLSKSLPVVHWGKVFNVKRQQQFQQIDTVQKNFQYACRKAIGQQLDCFLLNTKVPRSLHISTLKRGFFLLQPLIDLAKYMFFFFCLPEETLTVWVWSNRIKQNLSSAGQQNFPLLLSHSGNTGYICFPQHSKPKTLLWKKTTNRRAEQQTYYVIASLLFCLIVCLNDLQYIYTD